MLRHNKHRKACDFSTDQGELKCEAKSTLRLMRNVEDMQKRDLSMDEQVFPDMVWRFPKVAPLDEIGREATLFFFF